MDNKEKYIQLREDFTKKYEPVLYRSELAGWDFYTNSTEENLKKYTHSQEQMSDLFKDRKMYEELKSIQEKGLEDKHLSKQLKDLVKAFYNEIESGNELKALRDKENEIASKFNSYVMEIDGKAVSKAQIMKILEKEHNPEIRKKAYDANIKSGDEIADDLVEFVKMRNAYAKTKGYDTYFDYMIEDSYDITPKDLNSLLSGVSSKIEAKSIEFDEERKAELAKSFGIKPEELKDYHYGLLTDNTPEKAVTEYLTSKEQVVDIAKNVYNQMGFDVDNMGITLDLFPRKNKNTHGFAFCIKPAKDVRILANLTNNTNSLDTILHELGHCVYDIGLDLNLPFLEQEPSSSAMTEAVAMMMGDLPKTENILSNLVPQEILDKFKSELKKDDARFVNRSLQIIEFEREMYKNPERDLKSLWRDLKQKYLHRGDETESNNEWATIPHYLSHPGYYQNYFRAGLIKAQLYNAMKSELVEISKNSKTSNYLNEKLFKFGSSKEDAELIMEITGKTLSEDDFCNRIINN